jgi:hypothetical protein
MRSSFNKGVQFVRVRLVFDKKSKLCAFRVFAAQSFTQRSSVLACRSTGHLIALENRESWISSSVAQQQISMGMKSR